MINKVLAIFVSPFALLLNIVVAIGGAFVVTYKDNVEMFKRLEQ